MYEYQGRASQMGADANYAAQMLGAKTDQPDQPLLDYAINEIVRLTASLAEDIQRVNKFVDGVRGPVPTLLNSAEVPNKPLPPPNRGEALREAIRHLQIVRNAADEAASRLGGI